MDKTHDLAVQILLARDKGQFRAISNIMKRGRYPKSTIIHSGVAQVRLLASPWTARSVISVESR